jgi:hypothetical protein
MSHKRRTGNLKRERDAVKSPRRPTVVFHEQDGTVVEVWYSDGSRQRPSDLKITDLSTE